MSARELLHIPNLLSLSRVALTPLIGYFLWKGDDRSTIICLILLVIAGITDGLDGYFARRLGEISDLGKMLDPTADKLMAAVLVVLLILYRGFPVWLAVVVVGRDLLILLAAMLLLRGEKVVIGSNLTGKYTFSAIAVLLASYVIRFDIGIQTATWIVVVLIAFSLVLYARVFARVRRGEPAPVFHDRTAYRILRTAATTAYAAFFIYNLVVTYLI